MGHCLSRNTSSAVNTVAIVAAGDRHGGGGGDEADVVVNGNGVVAVAAEAEYRHGSSSGKNTPVRSFATSPSPSPYPAGIRPSPSPARATPRRFWPFPPPSPAKPILTMLRRQGRGSKQKQGTIQEDGGEEIGEGAATGTTLDKTFDYARNFGARFELGKEVGRGHFGHTCLAKGKKGELKGQPVAVKIISKDKVLVNVFQVPLRNSFEVSTVLLFLHLRFHHC